ncbi:MAG: hypothetical protein ACXACA_06515, partial [Candidatus Ranarchaeia archaeon]
MGLNFAGLGFSFGAKDEGFNEAADDVADSIAGIGNAANKVGDIAKTGKLNLLANAFQAFQLSDIKDQLERTASGLGDFSSAGIQQLDAISGAVTRTRVQFFGQGEDAKKMGKLVSKHIGLAGATVQEVEEAVAGLARTGMGVDEIEKDFKRFFKLQEVTGVKTEELGRTYTVLSKQFGFNRDQLDSLTDFYVRSGGSIGQSKEALQGLLGTVSTISEQFSVLGLSSEEMFKIAVGAQDATVAFTKFGIPIDDARALTLKFSETSAGLGRDLKELRGGLGGSLERFKEFGKAGLTVEDLFETFRKEPNKAIKQLMGMASAFDMSTDKGRNSFDRFLIVMEKQFGPQFASVMKAVAKGAEFSLGTVVPQSGAKARKSLDRLTKKGLSSSEILAKRLERQQEHFDVLLARIALGGKDVREEFIKNMKTTRQWIKEATDETETGLGNRALRALIKVKELGVLGLKDAIVEVIPSAKDFADKIGKVAPVLQGMGGAVVPALLVLNTFAPSLDTVTKAMGWTGKKTGWLIKKIWSLIFATKASEAATKSAAKASKVGAAQMALPFGDPKKTGKLAAVGGIFTTFFGKIKKGALKLVKGLGPILGVFGSIKAGIIAIGTKIISIAGAITAPFIGAFALAAAGVGAFVYQVVTNWDALKYEFSGLTELIGSGFDWVAKKANAVGGVIASVFNWVIESTGDTIPSVLGKIKGFFTGIKNFFVNLWKGKIGTLIADLLSGELTLAQAFKKAIKAGVEATETVPTKPPKEPATVLTETGEEIPTGPGKKPGRRKQRGEKEPTFAVPPISMGEKSTEKLTEVATNILSMKSSLEQRLDMLIAAQTKRRTGPAPQQIKLVAEATGTLKNNLSVGLDVAAQAG